MSNRPSETGRPAANGESSEGHSPGEERPDSKSPDEGRPEDLIEAFLSGYERLRTRKSYRHDLRDFFGEGQVTEPDLMVGKERVARYLRAVAEEKGKSAFKRRRAALRSFYKWAREEGLAGKGAKGAVEKGIEKASPQE